MPPAWALTATQFFADSPGDQSLSLWGAQDLDYRIPDHILEGLAFQQRENTAPSPCPPDEAVTTGRSGAGLTGRTGCAGSSEKNC